MYSRDNTRNVQSLPNLPTQASRGGIFTREAEQRMKDRIAAAANKISRFKTDAEYLEEEKRDKRRKRRNDEWKWRIPFQKWSLVLSHATQVKHLC